ncbi:MAG: LA2681 family HEPN domain-containing protein [Candidatus Paceibacterota bacterium]
MNNKTLKKEFEKIEQSIKSEEYEKALELLRQSKYIKKEIHYGLFTIWIGTETNREYLLNEGIKFTEKKLKQKKFTQDLTDITHYNLGNGYGAIFDIAIQQGKSRYEVYELAKKARSYFEKVTPASSSYSEARTNIGNLMDTKTLGRPIEAINFYEDALSKNPRHAMALGNKAMAIQDLAPVSEYSETCLVYAYQLYCQALNETHSLASTGGPNALQIFTMEKDRIKKIFKLHHKQELLKKDLVHPPADQSAMTEFLKFYTEFCLNNDLYLNLHMFDKSSEASTKDSLIINPVTLINNSEYANEYFFRLNEIKEAYITARYILCKSQFTNVETSTISKKTVLINTLDYSAVNLYVGLLKSAYKETIGVLDKIAILLNKYMQLGHVEKSSYLNYRNIWYTDSTKMYKAFNIWGIKIAIRKKQQRKINLVMIKCENTYLFGVYSLCQEIALLDNGIRNALTHRYLRVFRAINGPEGTYTFEELSNKTIQMQYLVKSTIISLISFINVEESKKKQQLSKKGETMVSIPLPSDQMLDLW